MRYKYIESISKQMEEVELQFGPLAFYVFAETLRIMRLGGSREFSEALFTSVILALSGAKEVNHTLWFVFLKELAPEINREELTRTSQIISDLASHNKANIRVPFSEEILSRAAEISPGLIDFIEKCRGGDNEVAGGILARYVQQHLGM